MTLNELIARAIELKAELGGEIEAMQLKDGGLIAINHLHSICYDAPDYRERGYGKYWCYSENTPHRPDDILGVVVE